MNGDVILIPVKGNCFVGNDKVGIREILLDLRFKVNYIESQAVSLKLSSFDTTFFYDIMRKR